MHRFIEEDEEKRRRREGQVTFLQPRGRLMESLFRSLKSAPRAAATEDMDDEVDELLEDMDDDTDELLDKVDELLDEVERREQGQQTERAELEAAPFEEQVVERESAELEVAPFEEQVVERESAELEVGPFEEQRLERQSAELEVGPFEEQVVAGDVTPEAELVGEESPSPPGSPFLPASPEGVTPPAELAEQIDENIKLVNRMRNEQIVEMMSRGFEHVPGMMRALAQSRMTQDDVERHYEAFSRMVGISSGGDLRKFAAYMAGAYKVSNSNLHIIKQGIKSFPEQSEILKKIMMNRLINVRKGDALWDLINKSKQIVVQSAGRSRIAYFLLSKSISLPLIAGMKFDEYEMGYKDVTNQVEVVTRDARRFFDLERHVNQSEGIRIYNELKERYEDVSDVYFFRMNRDGSLHF